MNVGRLVRWTKGFKCEGVEGEDVVRLLHEAIQRRGVSILFVVNNDIKNPGLLKLPNITKVVHEWICNKKQVKRSYF